VLNTKNYKGIEKMLKKNENILKNADKRDQKEYNRWSWFWRTRVDSSGWLDKFNEELNKIDFENEPTTTLKSAPVLSWDLLGPSTRPTNMNHNHIGIGRITSLWINPIDTSFILAASSSSGIWKTTNGGNTWSCLTSTYVTGGVFDIAVEPNNTNVIYIATKTRPNGTLRWSDGYSRGIFKSINGGSSWTNLSITFDPNEFFEQILIHPTTTSIVYACSNKKVYKSVNSGTSWTIMFTCTTGNLINMLFKPSDPNTIYVSGMNSLYKTNNGGSTWTQNLANLLDNTIGVTINATITIAVNSNFADHLYAFYSWKVINSTSNRLKKSTDGGTNWVQKNSSALGGRDYVQVINISPNSDIYAGGVTIKKSTDDGVTFPTSLYVDFIHDDIRDIVFPLATNNNLVYVATDGGVYKSINGGTNWIRINGDLSTNEFYGVGIIDDYPQVMAGGTHDCGSYYRNPAGVWEFVDGGDGGTSIIDQESNNTIYATSNNSFSRYVNGVWNKSIATLVDLNSPVVMHPQNSNTLYFQELNTSLVGPQFPLFKSVNNGGTITETTLDTEWDPAYDIAISYYNPNYIYYSTWRSGSPARIKKTSDGGATAFSDVGYTGISDIRAVAPITGICVDPTSPTNLWITFGGFENGKKVYNSNNGGASWQNVSGTNLPNLPVQCIEYDNLNQVLYIGTDVGMYSKSLTDANWTLSSGFPRVMVSDIDINKSNGDLVVATYGRGIWRASLWGSYCTTQSGLTTNINATTTWGTPKFLCQNLIINSGYTLKVTSTVIMPCHTTITVKSNAILEVDAGRIKYGKITVESGGKLILKNGAKITLYSGNEVNVLLGGLLDMVNGEIIKL
jgi:photosystem II stability/assembly factor-like uncharacterized protein